MGIPQSSILGSLVFSLYINDLQTCCKSAVCQMYADDIIIYVSVETLCVAAETLTNKIGCIPMAQKQSSKPES